MARLKTKQTYILLAVMVAVIACSPVIFAQGETIQLMNLDFYIEPSQPEVLEQGKYNITAADDFVLGIPDTEAIGKRSDSGTYYFEMTSTEHVEVYFLNSLGGPTSQYLSYVSSFSGDAPTDYTYFYICDGYLQFNFTTSISPKLVIWSDGLEVTVEFIWLEGFSAIEYNPYHVRIAGSDRPTNDSLHIFNTNASISAYILNDTQYEEFQDDTNIRPNPVNAVASSEDSTEINLNYLPETYKSYYIVLWHEEFFDGVTGTLTYEYTFNRTFFERYWSLLFIIVLLILVIVFAVFRKHTLPPVVWTMQKINYYCLKVPWRETKTYFKEIGSEFGGLLGRIRGISEEEEAEVVEISPHRRLVISLVSLAYPLSLHRFLTGKIGTAIISLLTQGLSVLFLIGTINQLNSPDRSIILIIVFILLYVVCVSIYLIDLLATFIGVFTDKKDRAVLKW